ncbi:MAG: ATP-binding protein [Promethearchaeota archaeon]
MSSVLDSSEFVSFYLCLNIVLIILNIIFFISRKRENSANKLKIIIIFLLGTAILIFALILLPFLMNFTKATNSHNQSLFSNVFLLLLCISSVLFFYSVYHSDDDVVELDKPSFLKARKRNIKICTIVENGHKKGKFSLSLEDLEKHMFVCGATGTGKSNFIQHFLMNFTKKYKIPFLLVEFKGEYHFLQRKIEDLIIIRPGENFSINIFNPGDSLPEVHAERIFDILKSGKFLDENAEFSPQMEKVLVEILTKICQNKKFQSWQGFYDYCKGYAKNKKDEIPMLSQTLISITNRIRRFSLGSLKALFDTEHKIKTESLFQRNILIDLSSIIRLGGEKEDALFFLNMILKYLWDKNLTRGAFNFQGIKHITIVEDTQYFAPKDLTRQNKLTTYLEDIALLQRGTGECLISLATHPDISEEILANCGVLVCFKTHIDKDFLCKLLNLDGEHEDYLSILEKGQCIARVNSIKRPFLLNVPLIPREWLEISEIKHNNDIILERLDNLNKENSEIPDNKKKNFPKNTLKESLQKVKNQYRKKMTKKKLKNKKLEDEFTLKKTEIMKPSLYETEETLDELNDYFKILYEKQEKRKKQ